MRATGDFEYNSRSRVADLAFDFQPFNQAELDRPVTIDPAHDPSSIRMAYDQSK